jgi:hypothetical protein
MCTVGSRIGRVTSTGDKARLDNGQPGIVTRLRNAREASDTHGKSGANTSRKGTARSVADHLCGMDSYLDDLTRSLEPSQPVLRVDLRQLAV